MKISVIMPTYNRAYVIHRAIESLISQTYKNIELIVINDGSNDNTEDIVEEYSKLLDIIYIKTNHVGVSHARNIGLKIASGEIIGYLDDDNLWEKNFAFSAVKEFEKDLELMFYYAGLEVYGDKDIPIYVLYKKFNRTDLLYQNYVDLNIFIHRKTLVYKFGFFDTDLSRLVDWDLILRYTKNTKGISLNEIGARYYVTSKNRITAISNLEVNLWKIINKNIIEIRDSKIENNVRNNTTMNEWVGTLGQPQWHKSYSDYFKNKEELNGC